MIAELLTHALAAAIGWTLASLYYKRKLEAFKAEVRAEVQAKWAEIRTEIDELRRDYPPVGTFAKRHPL